MPEPQVQSTCLLVNDAVCVAMAFSFCYLCVGLTSYRENFATQGLCVCWWCAHFWNCLKLRRSKDANAVISAATTSVLILLLLLLHISNRTFFVFDLALPYSGRASTFRADCACALGVSIYKGKKLTLSQLFLFGPTFLLSTFSIDFILFRQDIRCRSLVAIKWWLLLSLPNLSVGGVGIYGGVVCSLNYWLNNMKQSGCD